jgi:hypothetical protein
MEPTRTSFNAMERKPYVSISRFCLSQVPALNRDPHSAPYILATILCIEWSELNDRLLRQHDDGTISRPQAIKDIDQDAEDENVGREYGT